VLAAVMLRLFPKVSVQCLKVPPHFQGKILLLNMYKSVLYNMIASGGKIMVSDGRGRLFRRKDGKYLIYLPKDLAEDSMFPFKGADSILVKVSFKLGGEKMLIEKWVPPPEETEE
jgi:hypothetical protein